VSGVLSPTPLTWSTTTKSYTLDWIRWPSLIQVKNESRTSMSHVLQHAATHCNTLQNTAKHCNTLQNIATHCNTLQHTAIDLYQMALVPWLHSSPHQLDFSGAVVIWKTTQTLTRCRTHAHTHSLFLSFSRTHTHTHTHTYILCALLCFIKTILGNRYVRSRGFIVSEPRETHPRSEIADVSISPCPPLDNLGCLDPHPAP